MPRISCRSAAAWFFCWSQQTGVARSAVPVPWLLLLLLLLLVASLTACASGVDRLDATASSVAPETSRPAEPAAGTQSQGTVAPAPGRDLCAGFQAAKDVSDAEILSIVTATKTSAPSGTRLTRPRGAIQVRTELAGKLARISPPELRADFETVHANRSANQRRLENGDLAQPAVDDDEAAVGRIVAWFQANCGIRVTNLEF